jgi:hypothetical protein
MTNLFRCASVLEKLIGHLVSNSTAHASSEHKSSLIFVSPDGLLRARIDEPKNTRTSVVRCTLEGMPINSGGPGQNRICAIWRLDDFKSARVEQANSQFLADQIRTLSAAKVAQVYGPNARERALIRSEGDSLPGRGTTNKENECGQKKGGGN